MSSMPQAVSPNTATSPEQDADTPAAKRKRADGRPRRKRAPTACNSCRSRKTKCDGVRPVCGSCAKLGVQCVVNDERELNLYETTSLRVLEGLDRLEKKIDSAAGGGDAAGLMAPPSSASLVIDRFDTVVNVGGAAPGGQSLKMPSNLDRILAWRVFPKPHPPLPLTSPSVVAGPAPTTEDEFAPNQSLLRELLERYLANFHPSYPIVDISMVAETVLAVDGRSSCGWDARSCLMLLVCALGAISDRYLSVGSAPPPTESQKQRISENRDEAMDTGEYYWRMAVKRLGFIMSEASILAVQCLGLAGFWKLYTLDPVAAYKFFHCASVTWQTINLLERDQPPAPPPPRPRHSPSTPGSEGMSYPEYLKQRLYWTCLKTECEIRAELSLAVPTGPELEYPSEFPSPPSSFGNPSPLPLPFTIDVDRMWYRYTAEIFLRRLHNRLIDEVTSFENDLDDPLKAGKALSEKRIAALVTVTREFDVFIARWHDSLPPCVRFPIPPDDDDNSDARDDKLLLLPVALLDEHQQFLRKRYFDCKIMLYRPYINLAVNHSPWLQYTFATTGSIALQRDVGAFALRALRHAVWNLSADISVSYHRTNRTWFDCRGRLADAAMLRAAAKQGIQMPVNWRGVVESAVEALGFWPDDRIRGGLWRWVRRVTDVPS